MKMLQGVRAFQKLKKSCAYSTAAKELKPLPVKETVNMAYDLHLPERSVIGKMPYHSPEPIVFIHGLFGWKRFYRNDCKTLATALQTPVYAVDMRNHGDTEHAMPFDYNTLMDDLVLLLRKLDIKKVNLIGYSMGGKMSMLTALNYPELVSSACIIDNAPINQPHISPFLKVFSKSCQHVENMKIRATDKEWRSKVAVGLKRYIPNPGIRSYLLQNVSGTPPKKYRSPVIDWNDGNVHFVNPVNHLFQCVVKDASAWPVEQVAGKQFLGPVNFIRGTKSEFVNADGEKAIAEYFPYHKIQSINTTHNVLHERPQEYLRSVIDFFKTTRYVLERKRDSERVTMIAKPKPLTSSQNAAEYS
ncbi:uncharacterized protein Ecym_7076 [Eremothecium cymbalariae DBVPG|uniref:Ethanol acetyltransferase 1 n=1 Tax=Eremothecium cymbalariae (strain CBS 270.75 / DBVPG 7215 / KCTC 17166 / NRRL Y-17582) TaxID=931890 RepID=EAT1_ERECY|nr:hypothetical protein Ecym_7076 [Eremothecium cymbalariae DBVPG\